MDDRKNYWNRSYLEYWRSRVEESTRPGSDSKIIAGDAKTEGDEVYEMMFTRHPMHPGAILDVGCAWGRMFPLFKKRGLRISGIDISKAMIEQAQADWGADPDVAALREGEAEFIPFEDESFDNVVCLAVFDATYQDKALAEFFRVLRMDGLLYLTGKNDCYSINDKQAILAEEGARRKKHPNYFTDTASMLRQIQERGHEVVATYSFLRRGDFGRLHCVTNVPKSFYEYFIILRKKTRHYLFQPFSDSMSQSYRQLP